MKKSLWILPALLFGLACSSAPPKDAKVLEVTASAYTRAPEETGTDSVGIGAFGDVLKPGMKAIAVSRDLIELGLDHRTLVWIDGLEGVYVVRDKMNKRWKRKIDVFMGDDQDAARDFGKRTVTLRFTGEKADR